MTTTERTYLPAAGRDVFLPLYDPLTRLFGFDAARRRLLDLAALQPAHRVLDVGCGTGTLAVLIKRLYPAVEVIALDPDPKALARAQRKADRARVAVRFDRGFADTLHYPDATFDRVFSSMMFHHLDAPDQARALAEMRRVLRTGGRLEFLDFAANSHAHGVLARMVHAHERLNGNTETRLLAMMNDAGFTRARRVGDEHTLFGQVAYYQASA